MSLARNVFVQAVITGGSRFLGFARDVVISAQLGAGPVSDAFFTAQQFPNLFRRILAEGAFSQAFVPVYARTASEEGEPRAVQVASETLSVLLTSTLLLTFAMQLAMPWIMLGLQTGYRDDPDIFNLSIILTQITMPYLAGMAISALLSGVLNSAGRFALSAAVPTVQNVLMLGTALAFKGDVTVAWACSIATAFSGVLQAAWLFWGARRQGIHVRFLLPRLTPAVKRVIAIAVPGAVAASAMQVNILVSQSIASLEEGAKSWLFYADRLYQLPLGMIGVAVGVAILPRLSRAAAGGGDVAAASRTLDDGMGLAMAFTLPAAIALMVMPFFLVDGLFVRGLYDAGDARMTADALFHFGWGVPAFVIVKVLTPGFFAHQDTVRPMRYAMTSVVFNIAAGAGGFFWLKSMGMNGFPALAVATSSAAWLNALMLWFGLVRLGRYKTGARLASRVARTVLACAVLGGVLGACVWFRPQIEAALFGLKEAAIVATCLAGAVTYVAAAFVFGAVRLSDVKGAMRRS